MKDRVLFVDDNPDLLRGLKRMLRPMHNHWDMTFLPSGPEALQEMGRVCFDVVVSDMRMPEMDGAALLGEVKRACPRSVRLVLSGQADMNQILEGIGPIHQYLAKPCSPEQIIETILRTCGLRDLLTPTNLQAAVSRTSALPAHPQVLEQVVDELRQESPNEERLAGLVACDVGMSSKVLQLVNSSFFGVRHSVADPREATRILGTKILRPLVFDQKVFEPRGLWENSTSFLHSLTTQSCGLARTASAIAAEAGASEEIVRAAYSAGLLHGVGKLVLREEFVDEYLMALMKAIHEQSTTEEAEQARFGATHHEVGAYLLGLWGLPAAVSEAVVSAHRPVFGAERGFSALTAVHAAGALYGAQTQGSGGLWALDEWYLDMLGYSERLKTWAAIATQAAEQEEKRRYEH